MLLNELLKAIQPVQIAGDSNIEIAGINIDSRLVEAGQLFMAMRGKPTAMPIYPPPSVKAPPLSSARICPKNRWRELPIYK
jgi:UDP-N-acetylmuramoyl-L-alanyl-D-glutamate--2,6-diaminopimelate ligase